MSLSKDLATIPLLNKDQFLTSYVKTQNAFKLEYAQEGRMMCASWGDGESANAAGPSVGVLEPPKMQEIGFGTPILAPRIAKAIELHSNSVKTGNSDNIPVCSNFHATPGLCSKRSIAPSEQLSGRSKDKDNSVLEAEERKNRLERRRDRKRVKRDAMKPTNPEDISRSKRLRGGLHEKQVISKNDISAKFPGLALMHGFSATNVSKGRLTMEAPLRGVFSKGKASVKTHVTSKKYPRGNGVASFQETRFLSKKPERRKNTGSSTSIDKLCFSDCQCEASCRDDTVGRVRVKLSNNRVCLKRSGDKKAAPTRRDKEKSPNMKMNDSTRRSSPAQGTNQSLSENMAKKKTAAANISNHAYAESITWDIEKDDFSLPGTILSSNKLETMILDTKNIRRISSANEKSATNIKLPDSEIPDLLHDDNDTNHIASSPSVTPSQSASQAGIVRYRQENHLSVKCKQSDYFRPSISKPSKDYQQPEETYPLASAEDVVTNVPIVGYPDPENKTVSLSVPLKTQLQTSRSPAIMSIPDCNDTNYVCSSPETPGVYETLFEASCHSPEPLLTQVAVPSVYSHLESTSPLLLDYPSPSSQPGYSHHKTGISKHQMQSKSPLCSSTFKLEYWDNAFSDVLGLGSSCAPYDKSYLSSDADMDTQHGCCDEVDDFSVNILESDIDYYDEPASCQECVQENVHLFDTASYLELNPKISNLGAAEDVWNCSSTADCDILGDLCSVELLEELSGTALASAKNSNSVTPSCWGTNEDQESHDFLAEFRHTNNSNELTKCFCEGRALLLGYGPDQTDGAEAHIVKSLNFHWQPQKL